MLVSPDGKLANLWRMLEACSVEVLDLVRLAQWSDAAKIISIGAEQGEPPKRPYGGWMVDAQRPSAS